MATAEKMGMVTDMLGMMTKIAKVRAAMGRPVEAVEMLATVLAQPISTQQPLTDNTPIKDSAARALDELRDALGPEELSAALALGTSTPFEIAAKELIARRMNAPRDRIPTGPIAHDDVAESDFPGGSPPESHLGEENKGSFP
jgi:hypothetical protein